MLEGVTERQKSLQQGLFITLFTRLSSRMCCGPFTTELLRLSPCLLCCFRPVAQNDPMLSSPRLQDLSVTVPMTSTELLWQLFLHLFLISLKVYDNQEMAVPLHIPLS